MREYLDFGDDLYRQWSEGALDSGEWNHDGLRKALGKTVSLDHAPEPYLVFDEADVRDAEAPPLVFITTNPGGPQDTQTQAKAGGRPSYEALQAELVREYEGGGAGATARLRIKRMREIADGLRPLTKAKGFVQCEAVPFHSASLPGKRRLAKYLREAGAQSALARYQEALKAFLANKHVVSLDASNAPASGEWEHWLRRKADLLGFDARAELKSQCLSRSKGDRPSTCVFSQSKPGLVRAVYLTQGGNDFRSDTHRLCSFLIASTKVE